MNNYLSKLAKALLDLDYHLLSKRKRDIINAIAEEETVGEDVNLAYEKELEFGERIADRVARFGGSWTFILTAGSILFSWVAINSYFLIFEKAFDPYPFILLNLVLSMLAAFQAPIILMSQNRQSEKDRMELDNNFKTTLKIELELIRLHQKLDNLNDDLLKKHKKYKH